MKTETYILPAYWASALINDDYSGLETTDEREIKDFISRNHKPNCLFYCIDCSDEQFFAHSNDASSLGGDVLEYTFDVTYFKPCKNIVATK